MVLAWTFCARQARPDWRSADKGKGLISADIIARCTTGADWPLGEGKAPKGNVIWFTAEVLRSKNEAPAVNDPLGTIKEAEKRALKARGIDPKAKDKEAERKRKAD